MEERAGYREIFVPLNAGNGSNTGVAIEIAGLRGDLRVIAYGNFVMVDATVEVSEQGRGFVTDDGGFEVGAGEVADGFEERHMVSTRISISLSRRRRETVASR